MVDNRHRKRYEGKTRLNSEILNTENENDKAEYKRAQNLVRRKITRITNQSWDRNCSKSNTYLRERRVPRAGS